MATTYQASQPLTDASAAHVEAARMRASLALAQQVYAALQPGAAYTLRIDEAVTPARGRTPGSLTRTLTLTPQ